MPRQSHFPRLGYSNYTWRRVQITKFLVMQFSPLSRHLFGPNIILSTLFSNTLSLYSSLNVRDQVSHPYRTTYLLSENSWYSYHRKQISACTVSVGNICSSISFLLSLPFSSLLRFTSFVCSFLRFPLSSDGYLYICWRISPAYLCSLALNRWKDDSSNCISSRHTFCLLWMSLYVTSFYCRYFCGMLYGFVKVDWLKKKEEIEIKVNGSEYWNEIL
jgi:hypothetical protein